MYTYQPATYAPCLRVNYQERVVSLSGHSTTREAKTYYAHVSSLIEEFPSPSQPMTMEIDLQSFNLTNASHLVRLFKHIAWLNKHVRQISVTWKYDWSNQEMQHMGEDLSQLTDLSFSQEPYFGEASGLKKVG